VAVAKSRWKQNLIFLYHEEKHPKNQDFSGFFLSKRSTIVENI
jgi:hypothetical protein